MAAATELEGALGVITYLEPLAIDDTEQLLQSHHRPTTPPPPPPPPQQPLLREVNLMAAAFSPGPAIPVGKAARTLAVHCLLGLGAAYFHMGDAQVCV